jgi:hypothetical protein
MPTITVPPITIRTTSDGAGYAHGLAAGTGPTVDAALAALADEAGRQAEEAATAAETEAERGPHKIAPVPPRGVPVSGEADDTTWRFEVVDVRLVAGREAAEAWCAIGTLRSDSERPGPASYWQNR